MSYLSDRYNFGKEVTKETGDKTVEALSDMYTDIAKDLNVKVAFVITDSAPAGTPDANGSIPSTTDVNFFVPTVWVQKDESSGPKVDAVFLLTDITSIAGVKTAQWTRLN